MTAFISFSTKNVNFFFKEKINDQTEEQSCSFWQVARIKKKER